MSIKVFKAINDNEELDRDKNKKEKSKMKRGKKSEESPNSLTSTVKSLNCFGSSQLS